MAWTLCARAAGLFAAGLWGLGCASPDAGDAAPDVWPDAQVCAEVSQWDAGQLAFEEGVREELGAARKRAQACGDLGMIPAAPPTTASGALTCAARRHAIDLAEREYLGHVDPDGVTPTDRVNETNVMFAAIHEDLVAGAPDPGDAVALLLADQTQCADLMGANWNRLGVGYFKDPDAPYDGYLVIVWGQEPLP